jgi:hypothetical protein
MGFGGAVQGMISSLKNNSRRGKRDNYFQKGQGNYSEKSKGIPVIEISEEKRKAMREKLIAENKKYDLKILIIFIACLIVIFGIGIKLIFF